MTHHDILKKFNAIFSEFNDLIELWAPNGRHSIRIRLNDKREFIFTYNSANDWCFETVTSYAKRIKKEDKK